MSFKKENATPLSLRFTPAKTEDIDPYEQYYVFTDVMAFAPIEDDGTCPLITGTTMQTTLLSEGT